jgi:type VI secretion system protein ImpK
MSAQTPQPAVAPPKPRFENLALIFQEVLTAIERLRANRQSVTDAATFRAQIKTALSAAEQEALRRGYNAEDVSDAVFAVVAFLDESILNMPNPVFADWPRRPLQEELFGVHVAGEIFFRNIERLLKRGDSESLADLLELHEICLLLGFRGRFSASGIGEVRAIIGQIEERVRRIRGAVGPLSPRWEPDATVKIRTHDRVFRTLTWAAALCAVLALVLFAAYFFMLDSGISSVHNLASRITL